MDVAWLAPSAVIVVGAFGAAAVLRRIGESLAELIDSRRRFRRLEDALIPVRVETRRARASIDRFDRR